MSCCERRRVTWVSLGCAIASKWWSSDRVFQEDARRAGMANGITGVGVASARGAGPTSSPGGASAARCGGCLRRMPVKGTPARRPRVCSCRSRGARRCGRGEGRGSRAGWRVGVLGVAIMQVFAASVHIGSRRSLRLRRGAWRRAATRLRRDRRCELSPLGRRRCAARLRSCDLPEGKGVAVLPSHGY